MPKQSEESSHYGCSFRLHLWKEIWRLNMSTMIRTNIGAIPLEDYLDIKSTQLGFEDYEDLKSNGYTLEYNKEDLFEK